MTKELAEVREECKHYKDTEHGLIDCRNPFSGKCCECGKQVFTKQGIDFAQRPVKWWIKALLWFKPIIITYDDDLYEITVCKSKRLFGVRYIQEITQI